MRRPKPKLEPSEPVKAAPACPDCPHPASVHNQFGCCFTEEVCPCLMTRQQLEENEAQ